MATLFISDLHLEPNRPSVTKTLLAFLRQEAKQADALYILGDLFEAWIGDDLENAFTAQIKTALKELSAAGVPLYFMHGNRDFLVGDLFAEQTGARLLPDPCVVTLYGQSVLLMHGDSLCTQDIEYQQLRKMVRNPLWQADFLSKPISERLAMAQQLRDISKEKTSEKGPEIMDVSADEVVKTMQQHEVKLLIHGHTHRPAMHDLNLETGAAKRIVLGDWYQKAWKLEVDSQGQRLLEFPFVS